MGVTTSGVGGSGCTPPSPDTLPDGVWYGFITEWGPDEIGFDLACVEMHGENMTNTDEDIRTIPVAANAQYLLEWESFYAFSFAQVAAAHGQCPPPTTSDAVWLYINGGEVTQVEAVDEVKDDAALVAGTPYVPWGPELTAAGGTVGAYFPVFETRKSGRIVIRTPDWETTTTSTLGSGCSPGSWGSLPDGVWFVYIVDMNEDSIVVDLACYWGQYAWQSGPDAQECWEVEGRGLDNTRCNDPLVSNDDTRLRTNPLASDAQVLLDSGPFAVYSAVTVAALENHFWPIDLTYGNWIYVNDGEVTAITEPNNDLGNWCSGDDCCCE
jgi:hypothetical protein